MSPIYKTFRAVIRPLQPTQRFVYVLDSENPESSLADSLSAYMETLGFSAMFPNFDKLRVGTIHPFAILLAQDVLDQPQSSNLFPSVTVADTTMDEDAEMLADDYEALVFYPADIAALDGFRIAKKVYVSDAGWTKIQETVASAGHVIGIKKRYHTQHTLDLNIWTENKDVTSFLFDMVCHYITQERINVHNDIGIDMGRISGRRSGDINLDFGMLLYGANVRVQASTNHEAVLFDTGVMAVDEIDVGTLPQYFTLEAVT